METCCAPALAQFVEEHAEELVSRCRARVAMRFAPTPTDGELEHGVPRLLQELSRALRVGAGQWMHATTDPARRSGAVYGPGATPLQVVHDYGAACQAIAELAAEYAVEVPPEEFRALQDVLDAAIAQALVTYSAERDAAFDRAARAATERLGTLAHEIRNHLNTATLAYDALSCGAVRVGGRTSASLGRSLVGIRDLVSNALAEVRLGVASGAAQAVSVREFLAELEIGATLDARSRGVRLAIAAGGDDVFVTADPQILTSVVSNLLQNALKFTPPPGRVTVRAVATAERVRIEVEDECGGLPSGPTDRLFAAFEQQGADRTGVGLGLTIARRGAAALGGGIVASDLPGRGCVFALDLPRRTAL